MEANLIDTKNIILMKYGNHASEAREDIINRKIRETQDLGFTFWGYGGITCHPMKQVQPFLLINQSRNEKTYLILIKSNTTWNGSSAEAHIYSRDDIRWDSIPNGAHVYGSRFALRCSTFDICNSTIDLSFYRVAIGPSAGKLLSEYIWGQNTKACGRFSPPEIIRNTSTVTVSAIATVDDSVFIR